MKTFLMFALITASAALAHAESGIFCTNAAHTVKVSYLETNSGKVIFMYTHGKTVQVKATEADAISMEKSLLGNVMTVRNDKTSSPDKASSYVGVILPQYNLSGGTAVTFETQAVETTIKTSIAGPAGVQGLAQETHYYDVKCSAN